MPLTKTPELTKLTECTTPCPKKTFRTLSIVTWRKDIQLSKILTRIFLAQLAIKWPFNISPHPMFLHYLGKTEPTKYVLKWMEIRQKSIINIIDCTWLEEELTDFNNFWCRHFWRYLPLNDRYTPTSPYVRFCTTWENPNRRHRIKMQYFIDFVSSGSAETDNECSGKFDSHLIASCVRNIGVKNYWNLTFLL